MAHRIYSLKILRVISCLGVIMVHFGQQASLSGPFRIITDFGACGIYMFFIISGFLGFHSYSRAVSYKQYYIKRIFKILPIYYIIVIYDIILYEFILQNHFVVPEDSFHLGWLRYFLLLSKSIPSQDGFWNNLSATWTISYFALFYLLVPVLFKFINTYYKAVCLHLFCLALNYFWTTDWFTPIAGLYYFAVGIVIYLAIKDNKENHLITLACLMLIFFLVFSLDGEYVFNSAYIYTNIFMILVIATQNSKINNRFVTKCINVLDEYSYTIYLVHAVVIEAIGLIAKSYPLSALQIFMILAVGTAFISFVLHKLVEEPVNRVIRAKF